MRNESTNHLDITERKRLEHELKEHVKKLSSPEMMEAMMDGVCVIDVDAKIIGVNSAFEKLTGYPRDELIGEAPLKIHPERERETILAGIRECRERGFVTDFETVLLRRDKEEIPVLLNVTHAEDAEGKLKWMIATFRDITKRKRVEQELQGRHNLLRAVAEATPDVIFVKDLQGRYLMLNSVCARCFGTSVEEVIGKDDTALLSPDVARYLMECDRSIMTSEEAETFEEAVTSFVKTRTYLTTKAPYRDHQGNIIGLIGIARDITERKREQEALRKSEERFRALTESTSDWVWEVDVNGVYTYVSPKVKDLLGYEPEEVIGKTPFDLMPPEEAKRIAEEFQAIVESHRPFARLENTNRHKDGRLVVLETSGVPFFNADGRLCGYRGIDRDITECKRLEHELNERVKELNCLYAIARIAEKPDITLDELYQEVADLLPGGWQYPEITCARIIIDNKSFKTENYRETEWTQSSDIKVHEARAGVVQVCYLEERPEIDEGPFLEQERLLIDAVAERLGIITEHKRAGEALRETEARLRALVESTSDWVWEVDVNGVYTYVSPKVKDLLGYEPEEVIGKTPFDLMPPEEAKRIAEEFQAIVESHRPFARLENTNRHKDGRLVVLETSGVPFFDADGRLCGYRGIDRDITECKRLEHELKERVKELNCLYAIARIAEKPGITLDELCQEVADLLPGCWHYPEIACARIIIDNKRFETENCRETEWKQSSDIKVREARAGVVEVCYLEERPEIDEGTFLEEERVLICAVAERLGRTIERKQAEEALHETQEHARFLADVLERSSQPLAVGYPDGRLMTWNTAYCKLLGYSQEELHKLKWSTDLTPPEWREVVAKAAERIRATGQPQRFEKEYIRKDGSRLPVEVLAHPIFDSKGNLQYYYSFFTDITERKQAEEARVEYAAALARAEELQRSRQRIVKVQEVQRRDIAQQLHGSVQNRLIVLLHRLTELERAASPGELAAELRDLHQELGELLESQIRPISHRLYPSILRQGLVPALQSLGDQFEATVAIEMALDEELMRQERAERGLIPERVKLTAYRIAEEALNNMVKYAKASRAAIGLELSPEGWLRLTVRDDGQGFDVGSASGGLGILMMQDYAGIVGGECVIRSAPGEGTEVTATLPLARPGAKHPQRASPLE